MAIRFYDEALANKIKSWVPENSNLMILKPEEVTRLFQKIADNNNDKPIRLPLVALSREPSIEILSTNKKPLTFDGFTRELSDDNGTYTGDIVVQRFDEKNHIIPYKKAEVINAIPIKINYQLDIFTYGFAEGDEYLRNFIFQLINKPKLKITVPYNNSNIEFNCNVRILSTVEDNSDIQQRLFSGQFTRWTIKLEIDDAYLWSVPIQPVVTVLEGDITDGKDLKEDIGITYHKFDGEVNSDEYNTEKDLC